MKPGTLGLLMRPTGLDCGALHPRSARGHRRWSSNQSLAPALEPKVRTSPGVVTFEAILGPAVEPEVRLHRRVHVEGGGPEKTRDPRFSNAPAGLSCGASRPRSAGESK